MLKIEDRIGAFAELGSRLSAICQSPGNRESERTDNTPAEARIRQLIMDAHHHNGWFTPDMVGHMICAIAGALSEPSLRKWTRAYLPQLTLGRDPKTIGVVMAGNVPLVGFHDFLSVLMSGNKLLARLSSDDNKLLPALAELLLEIAPDLEGFVEFTDGRLHAFDAVIATGSDNSARYFEYYFGRYPHIIRKNRNGVAVLTGSESDDQLEGIADDIFLYYGLGCRNVSRLIVPAGYDFNRLLQVFGRRSRIAENHKYYNNYEYNKAIYLVNGTPYLDSGNLLLVEDEQIASPVSVVYYQYYKTLPEVRQWLAASGDHIQCVVSSSIDLGQVILPGQAQSPGLNDYADGVDTMQFLLTLDDGRHA